MQICVFSVSMEFCDMLLPIILIQSGSRRNIFIQFSKLLGSIKNGWIFQDFSQFIESVLSKLKRLLTINFIFKQFNFTSCCGGTYLGCLPQFLFFLTPFILEPDPDHPGTQSGHLRQLLLHQSVRSGVGAVAGLQDVQLLLRQHCPHLPCSTPSLTLRSSLPVFLILSRSYITV